MTGRRPSDWVDDTVIELEPPFNFDFEGLLKSNSEHLIEFSGVIIISIAETELVSTLTDFVFEYTFTGKIRGLGGATADAMVEYGVSRFKKHEAQTDEPLAILGLVAFIAKRGLSLSSHLRRELNTANPAYRGMAFEPFATYMLARAFSTPTPLSSVFDLVGEVRESLRHQCAELVALEKDGDNFRATPIRIKTESQPTHMLGYSASTADDTLKWLQDPQGSAFCFPANVVGPDVISVLRLTKDNIFLCVCCQVKHTKQLSSHQTEKALRTTDPSSFLSQKTADDDTFTCSDQRMLRRLQEAVMGLGKRTKKAATFGVLQVLCSYPSLPDDNKLEEAAKRSPPLATVAVDLLEMENAEMDEAIKSLADRATQKVNLATQRVDRATQRVDQRRRKRRRRRRGKLINLANEAFKFND